MQDAIDRNPVMTKDLAELKQQIVDHHPWHFKIDIRDGIGTEYCYTVDEKLLPYHSGTVTFLDQKSWIEQILNSIYPKGMTNRSVLDCACNCGAYCFYAKELGANRTFGFDVREHWINQAEFLRKNRDYDSTGMDFKVCDLYDVPKLNLEPHDFTFFKGIFYHLPDPITGLKIAADLTKEVMYFDTATTHVLGDEPLSGGLMASFEGTESFMSGVHTLNWYPTGPKVLRHILKWMGFVDIKVINYKKAYSPENDTGSLAAKKGRISILASKVEGRLDAFTDIPNE